MALSHSNVGHVDALSRRITGSFAVLAGVTALEGFFWVMPFLTWLVLAFMFVTGLFFLMAGRRGGTAAFGLLLMLLAALDGWLAVTHRGWWALLIGLVVGVDAFVTAQTHWSLLNALFHWDTHDADREWATPGAH